MFEKITEAEINERSMANVSTTPNRPTAFGESRMDAQALKLRFDRLSRYLAGRLNEIFAGISDGDLAKSVKIVEEKGEETIEYSLAEFILKMIEGDLTQINVKVPEGTQRLDVICNQVLRWQNEIKTGDFADETVVVEGVTIRQFYEEFKKLEETGQGKPGEPGKSAYDYAVEGGYQGTEEEFAKKLATEYPSKVSQLENDEKYITASGAPVQTVNGKAGNVSLSATDVGARPNTWTPTASDVGARPATWMPSYSDVNADKAGTAQSLVSGHNTSTDSHNDIRLFIQGLSDRINAVLDSDDTTLDELSEIVAYIKSNKTLIESVTTSKVNVADIIDNLTTNVKDKPLSAAQGVALKALIDALGTGKLNASELSNAINTALAQAKASGEFDGADGKTPYIQDGYWYIGGVNTNVKAQGADGHTPVKGTDYFTEAEIDDIAARASQIETPKIVSSVDEMIDTTKHYVLNGNIWAHRTVTTEGETVLVPNFTNLIKFDASGNPTNVLLNKRYSASAGAAAGYLSSETGSFAITDAFDLSGNPTIYINKKPTGQTRFAFFEEDGTTLHSNGVNTINASAWTTGDNGEFVAVSTGTINAPKLKFATNMSSTAITADSLKGLIVTLNKPITYTEQTTEGETISEWYDTKIPYAPTFKTDLVGVMGEGNVIYLSDNLPSGTYTLKYPDNNYSIVGTITK